MRLFSLFSSLKQIWEDVSGVTEQKRRADIIEENRRLRSLGRQFPEGYFDNGPKRFANIVGFILGQSNIEDSLIVPVKTSLLKEAAFDLGVPLYSRNRSSGLPRAVTDNNYVMPMITVRVHEMPAPEGLQKSIVIFDGRYRLNNLLSDVEAVPVRVVASESVSLEDAADFIHQEVGLGEDASIEVIQRGALYCYVTYDIPDVPRYYEPHMTGPVFQVPS